MSQQEQTSRTLVRTNKTFNANNKDAASSYVLKFDVERAEDLIAAIEQAASAGEEGVTIFATVYENESKFEDQDTYLSTVLDIQTTVPYTKTEKAESNRNSTRKKLDKNFRGRSNNRRA